MEYTLLNLSLVRGASSWLLRLRNGRLVETHRADYGHYVLDLSIPEVRRYIEKVFKTIIKDWGYEGIKLDFFSLCFEVDDIRYRCQEKTDVELRNWLFRMIRSYLPKDGFLLACYGGMGNQFIGKYADTFRFGADINDGFWRYIMRSIEWSVHLMRAGYSRLCIPDSDSAGYLEKLNREENRTWLTYCLVSRTMVETGGDFPYIKEQNLVDTKKVLVCPNNGEPVYFGDFDIDNTKFPPSVWYFNGNAFSLDRKSKRLPQKFVAVFNWGERKRKMAIPLGNIGLDNKKNYLFFDYWRQKSFINSGDKIKVDVPPHGVRAFHIVEQGKRAIVDADVKIVSVIGNSSGLRFSTYGRGHKNVSILLEPERLFSVRVSSKDKRIMNEFNVKSDKSGIAKINFRFDSAINFIEVNRK